MLNNTLIQKINYPEAEIQGISVSILRLDLLHPVVSGNKLFKLTYYLAEAIKEKKQITTFGGPYSNHLVATAYAAQQAGLASTGYVRGAKPKELSDTLKDCMDYGMELKFVSYSDYQQLQIPNAVADNEETIVIPYGGYGQLGVKGAKEILDINDTAAYDLIIASVGSGTMGAGLLAALKEHQQLLLFSAVKNNFSVEAEIKALLSGYVYKETSLDVNHDYHFGGFAKTSQLLFDYMNQLYEATSIPTDIVYTGKLMYGINDMLKERKFRSGSKILVIHSGGLQGNRSLKNNQLIF